MTPNAPLIVDVREDLQAGREPFGRIMNAVSRLGPAQSLVLVAPFEPAPLFEVMRKLGFAHRSNPMPDGGWKVIFERAAGLPQRALSLSQLSKLKPCCGQTPAVATVELDARGWEPPRLLAAIMEALARLPSDTNLRALTDRKPVDLYEQLKARGYEATTEQLNGGSFATSIRRV